MWHSNWEISKTDYYEASSSRRATGMNIQIEGAYFKMDLAIIKVNSVLLVLQHQSGYSLIGPDWLPTSMLCTFVKTTTNVHKYAAGSVKICFILALMWICYMEELWRTDAEVQI